jgi:hypothetical protein
MVDPEAKLQRLITPEIAELYGRSTHTVTKAWAAHPEWPAPVGKRGRYNEYDAEQVAAFVRAHAARHADDLEPDRLYTAQQIGDAAGISAGTIRADVSKGRWPAPDARHSPPPNPPPASLNPAHRTQRPGAHSPDPRAGGDPSRAVGKPLRPWCCKTRSE